RATQESPDHFETFIIEFQLLRQIRSVDQQVKMIRVSQRRTGRVAPSFSVEMQTQHKVRTQFEIHQRGTAPNLTVAVEQDFTLPMDGLLFLRISRIKNFGAGLWHAISNENLPG